MSGTWRATQKANRRTAYLEAAAQLFAARGYGSVSIEDLGEAAGVSGPALYSHFSGKEAILVELLVGVSERLLAGCRAILDDGAPPLETLRRLVAFHAEFALAEPDTIRIQDRDLALLPPEPNRRVRSLQRAYVDHWSSVLAEVRPELDREEREVRMQGTFGLLNSTPYSVRRISDPARGARILVGMALAGLLGDRDRPSLDSHS